MKGRITSVVTVYRRTRANKMIGLALDVAQVSETHFSTANTASRFLEETEGKNVAALIIDRSIIDGSNGDGTRLINSFNKLGLIVFGIIGDGQSEVSWANESIKRSNLHLRF